MISRLPLWVILIAVVGCISWAGWLGLRHLDGLASPLDRPESTFLDQRILLFGPRPSPPHVTIVAIDDATVNAEGGYPIARDRLAMIVEGIRDAGAKALAIDLLLLDETDPESDGALAQALASFPAVIAGAATFGTSQTTRTRIPRMERQIYPLQIFQDAAKVGLINVSTDAGGTPRHLPLVFETSTGLMPSLILQAVGLYQGTPAALKGEGVRIAGDIRSLDLGWHLPLRGYGRNGTIRTISASAFLDPGASALDLEGQFVLLGATATGIGDRFATSFDPVLPGVEVLATGIANLLDGTGLIRDSRVRWIDASAAMALGLIAVMAISTLSLVTALPVVLASLTGWATVVILSFGQGYWLSASLPLAALLPPVLILILYRVAFDRRQAELQIVARQELGRFQSPALATRIAEDPQFLRVPATQDAAILFLDLAGFTGVSERLGAVETREILKAFHTLIVEESGRHKGLVLDFMGDGAMIGFGIPDPGSDDATNAVRAAFALARAVMRWIEDLGLQSDITSLRVGGHCGQIALSRLGHETQQQIAATGDCVNVASRLMDIGKDRGAVIVVSTHLLELATGQHPDLPRPDVNETVSIRGRQGNLSVAMWRAENIATR